MRKLQCKLRVAAESELSSLLCCLSVLDAVERAFGWGCLSFDAETKSKLYRAMVEASYDEEGGAALPNQADIFSLLEHVREVMEIR